MVKKRFTLGSFIAQEREKLNLSQLDLAKKCNIPPGTVASIESGYAKSPRSVTLKKIAEGLNVSLEILFKFASSPEKEIVLEYEEPDFVKLPTLGEIPSKNIIGEKNKNYLTFPSNFVDGGDFLMLVKGDNYTQEDIYDNDIVVVMSQNYLKRSGDLMVVKSDNMVTLARVYKYQKGYKLDNFQKNITVEMDKVEFIGKAVSSIAQRKL